jgi:hypothetical protein
MLERKEVEPIINVLTTQKSKVRSVFAMSIMIYSLISFALLAGRYARQTGERHNRNNARSVGCG